MRRTARCSLCVCACADCFRVSDCKIGPEGARFISSTLERNTTLRELNFECETLRCWRSTGFVARRVTRAVLQGTISGRRAHALSQARLSETPLSRSSFFTVRLPVLSFFPWPCAAIVCTRPSRVTPIFSALNCFGQSSPPLQQQPSRPNPLHPRHPHAIHSFKLPSPQSRQKEGAADTQEPLHVLLSAFPVAILQLFRPSQPTHIAKPWAIAPSWTLPLRKLFKTPSPRCNATTRLSRK